MISTSRNLVKKKSSSIKYEQLETVRKVAVIPATGTRFVNGVSNKYEGRFPKELQGLVDQDKYEEYMAHLNRKVRQFWPCCFAYYCGYGCLPLTLGLSLLIPRVCINEAEAVLNKEIVRINKDVLGNSKLEMRLVKKCYDSYLLVEERDFSGF